MKTEKNILIAFILNFIFSIFEFVGGIITGSVAIMSDSIHDIGDAISIGVSYVFEKISHKKTTKKTRKEPLSLLFPYFFIFMGFFRIKQYFYRSERRIFSFFASSLVFFRNIKTERTAAAYNAQAI